MNVRHIHGRIGVVVVSLALLLASGGCDKNRAEGIKLVNSGIRVLNAGDREASYSYFVRATRIDPDNHRAYYEMALIDLYDKADAQEKGISNLEVAEKLQPKDRDVLYQLGRAYVAKGERDRGVRYLERALAQDPNYAPSWYHKAVGLQGLERFEEADKAYREAIACDPMYTQAYRDLGEMYEQFDAHDTAAAVYEEGLRHLETDADLLNGLGLLAMRKGDTKAAIAHFDRAKSVSASRYDVVFNLAFAYVEAGDTREAYRNLGEFINATEATDAEYIKVAAIMRTAMLEQLQAAKRAKEDAENPPDAPK